MSEEKKEQTVVSEEAIAQEVANTQQVVEQEEKTSEEKQTGADTQKKKGGARRQGLKKNTNRRRSSRFSGRPKPEFDQKIINISRVTRVVKGGRRLSFRVDMIIGDKKGRVGLGSGKATDTSIAIQKALSQAKKNLIYLKLTKNHSIPYEVEAKVTSSVVHMMPNKQRGLVAGSTMRSVLKLAGITDVTARVLSRSKNKLNNAKAAILALKNFQMSHKERQEFEQKIYGKRKVESSQRSQGSYRGGRQGPKFNRKPQSGGNRNLRK